jgi:hypothetical protein
MEMEMYEEAVRDYETAMRCQSNKTFFFCYVRMYVISLFVPVSGQCYKTFLA